MCKIIEFPLTHIYYFVGDAVSTKSRRKSEKPPRKVPAMDEAVPSDPVKDAKAVEEIHDISLETKPGKDSKKISKGKNTMDQGPAKSRTSAAAPRITIKLVAKKKVKTIKEPQKKADKKLEVKGVQDQPDVEDIRGDQILSAHIKLKTESYEEELSTGDKGVGTIPIRRRGRSAVKVVKPVSQTTAKDVVDDQKEKEQTNAVKDIGSTEQNLKAKGLKNKNAASPRGSVVKRGTRRSTRVNNPPSKNVTDSVSETESLSKPTTVLADFKSEVSQNVEAKPVGRGGRRQSRRLNKDITVTENQDSLSTEPENIPAHPGESLSVKTEDMRVPSIKLIRIRNPKYDAQTSGKTSTRKKKRKKYIWTLALVKVGSPRPRAKYALNVSKETVTQMDKTPPCDTFVKNNTRGKGRGKGRKSKQECAAKPESMQNVEKELQSMPDSETSSLQVQAEVEPTPKTPPQEITKADCGKVPPLQIKKVSSPGKHRSSKPSFLIQQVSPVSENKEDTLKDPPDVQEDKSCLKDTETSPGRRLRRRASSLESPQKKSVRQKPATTQKRRLRKSLQDEETPQIKAEVPSQVSTEQSAPQVLPTNSCPNLSEDQPQVTSLNTSEVLEKESPKPADSPSQTAAEVCPQTLENKLEPQIEEAKPLPVPSKPRKPRNKQTKKKKKSVPKQMAVVLPDATIDAAPVLVDFNMTEPVQPEKVRPSFEEVCHSEEKERAEPEAETKQEPVSVEVEEKQMQPTVKEEPDMQSIDSQQLGDSQPLEDSQQFGHSQRLEDSQQLGDSQRLEDSPQLRDSQRLEDSQELENSQQLGESEQPLVSKRRTSDLIKSKKSSKKLKKKRKNLIGQRQKHRHRGRDGKFAPLKSPEGQSTFEANDDGSPLLAAPTPTQSSTLVGVQKKYKKKHMSLPFVGAKKPKSKSKIISKLLKMEMEKGSLKQEETDTPVDSGQPDAVNVQPSKSKFVKNIKHFIMPVVSARSSRVIKTPQRFMDDVGMSVLPRRHSPKKGLQLGLNIRPGKRRDDGAERPLSPIFPIDDEDILSEAQLDVDLFSAQDLEDSIDLADSLFFDCKNEKNEKKKPSLKNSSFKWNLPEDSCEDLYTLDKSPESKCEDVFSPSPADKLPEPSPDLLEVLKKKSPPKFNKQAAHLKIYQRLKKPVLGLPKSKVAQELEPASKPSLPPVDLAEGLDDEVMSISLRQRDTSVEKEKEKSKIKIEDLDSPGVVRKVSVCLRTPNSNSVVLKQCEGEALVIKDTALRDSGETVILIRHDPAKCFK